MGATLMLMRNPTAARPLQLLLLLPRYVTTTRPVLLLLLLPRHATVARPVLLRLLLPRHATVARPVLLQLLLLPKYATAARPVLLLLWLLLLPRHATAAHGPPVPKTTADDKSMGVRGFRRRTHRRPLFRNLMGLALRLGGTDGVFKSLAGHLEVSQRSLFSRHRNVPGAGGE